MRETEANLQVMGEASNGAEAVELAQESLAALPGIVHAVRQWLLEAPAGETSARSPVTGFGDRGLHRVGDSRTAG
ncbi:MAG: hypothetical protein ACOYYS_27025 [Chloroflexota bacterium]